MALKGWNSIEVEKTEALPKNSWALGYFHSSQENWDGKTWMRNLQELRLRDLALFALGDVRGKKILDIGCGSGEYMLTLAKMGGHVSGQDLSSECVNKALTVLKENGFGADVKAGGATRLLFSDNYFDEVFSADFFEHITHEQKIKVISEAYRVLKPGGVFVIKTPNLDYLKVSLFLKKIVAVLKFKSPFNLYIAHTHHNPDTEHKGLTTYSELEKLLFNNMFHEPDVVYASLIRKRLPMFITKFLFGKKKFTEQIIITARKPLFYGFYS